MAIQVWRRPTWERSLWPDFDDFERAFRITGGIDSDRIDATMKNGILRIVLPKSKEAMPQKISVKAG